MGRWRLLLAVLFTVVTLASATGAASPARAQSDAELKALNDQVIALYNAGKYGECLTLQRTRAAAIEKAETTETGKAGPKTAGALGEIA